ncbi:MAG: 2-hydroxyacyl-CoA dehydratase [Chloroflexi bacterium]|nr:2-hydroxyacyl-CoA dehydratase [Chloroflexota bacterium]
MQERKVNRLNSTSLIRPMIDEHWESLRKAKERGQKTVWCAGVPSILTSAMGIPTHLMPGFGSYCAATKGIEPLLEAAEADGQLIETCSYHRLHMGLLALHRKQLPIRDDLNLPVPDLMVVPRGCTEQSHYADAVHRYSGVPVVCIDMPPPHRGSDIPSNINYMERQLKEEAIPAIEKLLGRRYDFDKLSEMMATVKQVGILREECLALNKNIPAPWTLVDIAVSLGPVTIFPGKPGTVEFYQAVKAELEERVKNKVGALPTEKYRLYWDAMIMWGWLGMISRRFASWDTVLVAGRYPWEFWPYPERIEPSDPLRSLAEQLILMFHKQPPQNAIPYLTGLIKDYSIDGAVIFSPRTCRLFGIAAPELANHIVRKLGVPTVVIDADVVDPKFFSEAQVNTRLQALFEMMEARRAHSGGVR